MGRSPTIVQKEVERISNQSVLCFLQTLCSFSLENSLDEVGIGLSPPVTFKNTTPQPLYLAKPPPPKSANCPSPLFR